MIRALTCGIEKLMKNISQIRISKNYLPKITNTFPVSESRTNKVGFIFLLNTVWGNQSNLHLTFLLQSRLQQGFLPSISSLQVEQYLSALN